MNAADKVATCKSLAACKDPVAAQMRQQRLVSEHVSFAERLLLCAQTRVGALRQAWSTLGGAQALLEEFANRGSAEWQLPTAEQV